MHTNGHVFLSANHQVWLTATVPPRYLTPMRGPKSSLDRDLLDPERMGHDRLL
jgi:RNA:NAD 2'-phosphotransferase (TPT1/KptA family)